jgi:4-hydroxybenzoate polyprenyltransferase
VWTLAAALVPLLLQNQMLHEAADAGEDRAGGVRSTYLALGPRGASVLAALLGIAVAVVVAVMVATQRSALGPIVGPAVIGAHAVAYAIVFPALLGRARSASTARAAQRWSALASGALLFALSMHA